MGTLLSKQVRDLAEEDEWALRSGMIYIDELGSVLSSEFPLAWSSFALAADLKINILKLCKQFHGQEDSNSGAPLRCSSCWLS